MVRGVRGPRLASDLTRFAQYVELGYADHWLWAGSCNKKGYGRFWFHGGSKEAHRVAYRLLVEEIPEGLEIDHLCRIRNCVNPAHLQPVTPEVNYRRGRGVLGPGQFERCRSGRHLMSETRVFRGKNRLPRCRVCELERTAINNAAARDRRR